MSELKELLKQEITTENGLTLKEQNFLEILYTECNGDIRLAMDKSGFHKDESQTKLIKKLNTHIKEYAKDYLIANTGKAVISLVQVLNDPTALGAKNVISASKEILDRGGVFKEEAPQQLEVRNVFILPAKHIEEVEDTLKVIDAEYEDVTNV